MRRTVIIIILTVVVLFILAGLLYWSYVAPTLDRMAATIIATVGR